MRLSAFICLVLLAQGPALSTAEDQGAAVEWAAAVQKLQPVFSALDSFRAAVAAGAVPNDAWAEVLKVADRPRIPYGDENALLRSVIGAGRSPVQGVYASRERTNRLLAAARFGASAGSESAVEAALRWFVRHQSPSGVWDAVNFNQNCSDDPKSKPGSLGGYSEESVDVATTGLALLSFLGAGYDHKADSAYRRTVKTGVDYLLSRQKPDGLIGERSYEHAIATMALAEALALSQDPTLRLPTQRAAGIILKRQSQDSTARGKDPTGLGWDYVNPSIRQDISVSGWNVQALRSVAAAGLNVQAGLEGSRRFLERSWKDCNTGKEWCADWKRIDPAKDISRYPYVWNSRDRTVQLSGWDAAAKRPVNAASGDLAAVGLAMAAIHGYRPGDLMLDSLGNYVVRYQTPAAYPCNTYYLYYGTMGLFQLGGARWNAWNGTVRELLVGAQRTEGCVGGSWDATGTVFLGAGIGRVLSTALNCLTLEAYYRYERAPATNRR